MCIRDRLDRIEKDKDKEYEQLEFYKSASQLEIFDKRIARMPMNPVTIDQEIKRLVVLFPDQS